jgi:hypothetical protein
MRLTRFKGLGGTIPRDGYGTKLPKMGKLWVLIMSLLMV